MKNQVVEWLRQGSENNAADVLSRCRMEVETSGGFTTRPDGVTRKHSKVRIYAPRGIYRDLNETLSERKHEIDSAIHDCAQGSSLEVDGIYWLPQVDTARKGEANEINKGASEMYEKISIFISHSESDVDVAEVLVEFISSSIDIRDNKIRCTSVPGHQLQFGKSIPQLLKDDIQFSPIIIALLTKRSLSSIWVMFELGASWAFNKTIFPILGPGLNHESLPGPLGSLPCILIDKNDSKNRLRDAIKQISMELKVNEKTGGKAQSKLDQFVTTFRASIEESSTVAETPSKGSTPHISASIGYEKIDITSALHKYRLNLDITLKQPPDQDFFHLNLLWPSFIRINKLKGFSEEETTIVDGIRYKKLSLFIDKRIFPGQTIQAVGKDAISKIEYEFDNGIFIEMREKNPDLKYEVFTQNWQPVNGRIPFSELNIF